MNIKDVRVLAAEADAAWFADELTYAWRSAQDEAVLAYQAGVSRRARANTPSTAPLRTVPTRAQDVLSYSSSNLQIA